MLGRQSCPYSIEQLERITKMLDEIMKNYRNLQDLLAGAVRYDWIEKGYLNAEKANENLHYLLPNDFIVFKTIVAKSSARAPRYWLNSIPKIVVEDYFKNRENFAKAADFYLKNSQHSEQVDALFKHIYAQQPNFLNTVAITFDQTYENRRKLEKYGLLKDLPYQLLSILTDNCNFKLIHADFEFYQNPKTPQYLNIVCDSDNMQVTDYYIPSDWQVEPSDSVQFENKKMDEFFYKNFGNVKELEEFV